MPSIVIRDAIYAIVIIVLIGVSAESIVTNSHLRSTLYSRCRNSNTANAAANDFRRAEVAAFTALANPPETPQARHDAYLVLAAKAQKAIDAYKPGDCEEYR